MGTILIPASIDVDPYKTGMLAGILLISRAAAPPTPRAYQSASTPIGITRRRLGLGVVGTSLAGNKMVSAQDRGRRRQVPWTFAPVPVAVPSQGGIPGLGPAFHVFAPTADNLDQEVSSIGNLNGFVGYAFISGTVTQINAYTGEQQDLPFIETDMRFMTGNFVGADGKGHHGTFAFV